LCLYVKKIGLHQSCSGKFIIQQNVFGIVEYEDRDAKTKLRRDSGKSAAGADNATEKIQVFRISTLAAKTNFQSAGKILKYS
jgi:hypothetical protein